MPAHSHAESENESMEIILKESNGKWWWQTQGSDPSLAWLSAGRMQVGPLADKLGCMLAVPLSFTLCCPTSISG